MPRSVPPRDWYDNRLLDQGSQDRGERDSRAPGGPDDYGPDGTAGPDVRPTGYGPRHSASPGYEPSDYGPGDYGPDGTAWARLQAQRLRTAAWRLAWLSGRAITDRAITDRAITDRAITDRAITDPAITGQAITGRAITNRAITDQATTRRATTDPAITNGAITGRAITRCAITNRAITNRAITNRAITNRAITGRAITGRAITGRATAPRLATGPDGNGPDGNGPDGNGPDGNGPNGPVGRDPRDDAHSGAPGPGGRDGRRRTVKPHRRRLRRLLTHRSVQAILIVLVLFLGWVGWSVGQAMTAPGNGTASTRLAEWARDHYLGPVVTFSEWLTYKAPKVGGKPQFSLAAPATGGPASATAPHKPGAATITPIVPAQLSSPAGSPLPGEGQWRVLASVGGVPAIYGTYLRPDSIHTSYVAGIASMDQRLLTFQLRPGAEDPGPGNWGYSPWLPPGSRTGLLATFNGGFKLDSAGGGFYLNGLTKGTLTSGAASLVYYKNGEVAIGSWDHGVGMSSNVLGVRQNLKLIVDHGTVPASVDQDVQSQWGATLGGGYYVWRSGVGITSDGRIIFVYGPALSVRSLAGLLQRAGAVNAMQMDINPAWMSYMYYKPSPSAADPAPVNLLPDQQEPADRYYSVNSRDFTAVFAR